MANTFLLSDESLNSYGFWVKTSGIDLSQFKKNSVMLYDHNTYGILPIGKWTNIRVEDNKLLADAEFDTEDDFAQKIAKKVENGYIKGASIGLDPKVFSEQKADLKPGQTRSTLARSELLEASITPFPSNRNALKLKQANGEIVKLSANNANNVIPQINLSKMKELKTFLGLSDEASETEVLNAVKSIKTENQQLAKDKTDLYVKLGEQNGKINKDNHDKMVKLANTDFELALSLIEPDAETKDTSKPQNGKTDDVRLSDVLAELQRGKNKPDKTFRELADTEPETLQKLHDEDIDTFKKMYKAEYGVEYN